jgi:hypothetical protein
VLRSSPKKPSPLLYLRRRWSLRRGIRVSHSDLPSEASSTSFMCPLKRVKLRLSSGYNLRFF